MIPIDPKLVALQFNECINRGDVASLSALMTEDHRFIDRVAEWRISKDTEENKRRLNLL